MDEDGSNGEEDNDKSPQHVAPEYKRLIAIHAGKPKGGLVECLKVDPDKVRRLSLSEQQLEKASEVYAKEIVRYLIQIFCELVKGSLKFLPIYGMAITYHYFLLQYKCSTRAKIVSCYFKCR